MADKKRRISPKKLGKKSEKRPKIDRVVAEAFQESIRQIRKTSKKSTGPKLYDFTGEVLRRRKEVASLYLEKAKSRWGEKYPELDMGEEWARVCAAIGHTVQGLDRFYHISLACALWILDALEENNNLNRAARYLPQERESFSHLPDFFEPRYENDTVRRMIYLLRSWGKEDNVLNCCASLDIEQSVPWQEPDENIEELSDSERLTGILSLIHPNLIRRAVRRFEDKIWEFLDNYFACIAGYAREENLHLKKSEQLFEQCREIGKSLGFPFWEGEEQNDRKVSALALPDSLQSTVLPPVYSDKVRRGEVKHLEAIVKAGVAEEDETDKCENQRLNFAHSAGLLPILEGSSLQEWLEQYGAEAAKLLGAFTVDDPYEICFGFLCLVETGSDLPWLYPPAVAVLLAAIARLPWMEEDVDGDLDGEDRETDWEDLNKPDLNEAEMAQTSVSPADRTAQRASLYALNYTPEAIFFSTEIPNPPRYRNLPQLVYAMTGLIMPRSLPEENEERLKQLTASGMPKEEALLWERYLQLADDVQSMDEVLLGDQVRELLESCEDEHAEEGAEDRNPSLLEERVRVLEGQLSKLRGELYQSSREAERRKAEVEQVRTEAANEHQELLDLRELVFNLETGAEPELRSQRPIQFPFEVRRRTVVFGGHDTWLKAIRPMLPNVNFVGREVNPSADMIRHADVVWIQANALAHKRYYKIIDIVRVNHIPVRYFGYASAEKCALQLAASD